MTSQAGSTTPAPARLLLVRHGKTRWNAESRYNGVTDVELEASAFSELEATALAVGNYGVDRIFASPQVRAQQSARLIAAQNGRRRLDVESLHVESLHVESRKELRELDFGDFEGRTRQELLTGSLAAAFAAWLTGEDGSPAAPGGETWQHAAVRAGVVLDEATRLGGTTLIVSHGYLLRILLLCALEVPASTTRRLRWANGGLTELVMGDVGWSLVRHNWVAQPQLLSAAAGRIR